MAAPIDLRNDFDSVSLRRLAKRTRDATQSRRLLALAEVYDGGSRTDASRIGGVGLQIIRDWVLRFNARGPDGLVDGKSPGAPSKLNADHRRALAEVVEAGPVPAVDGVVRWRRKDLARWLLETFAISLDETTVGRELKALGFAKISARPRHYAQNELAVEAFKKNFPAELAKIRARLPKGVEIELWWQDEARIGQKNKLTRRWARRGTRPRAPRDQRTEWAYIFGAICPAKEKGAGLVMPWCDTDAMAAHLIEISAAVDPGAHAVLIVDQAGWHLTPKLAIPDNITVLALPPRSPELNPVENVWQFICCHRIFKSYEDMSRCCQAWNNLIEPIMSLHAQMGAWVLINDRWYYLRLIEHKIMAFDQAAPLQGWDLPAPFKTLQRLLEARQGKTGKREYVQVLRLLERFELDVLHIAIKDALRMGAISFDAIKHLVLCRVERRPPRLDLDVYPFLPSTTVATTSAASYMSLLDGGAP